MSARVQSSPFRETEWDQRLDRMLDDLKSTVTDDEDRRTPLGIRSSSRSSSRAGSVGRRGDGVGDGGRLTHHRKEYTSPDSSVRTVADTYQYDSGDTHPSGSYQKKVVKSTYSSYNVDGGLSQDLDSLRRGPSDRDMERALTQESRNILNSSYVNKTTSSTANNSKGQGGRSLSNGHYDDDVIVNDEKSGEVRRIVWRNRYEKTYETNDATTPTVTIEKDARNRRYQTLSTDTDATTLSSLTRPHVPPQSAIVACTPPAPLQRALQRSSLSPKQLTLQYAVYWPSSPNISPGGMSWAEPVSLPTPPQVSPGREPGVAYIYNYGSSGGSAVQPLPPLNYVAVAPPTSEGAPSPTPSALTTGQPVIYHYSYHYTIQPGQALPEGAHPHGSPPALQIVPPPATGYSTSANTATSAVNKSTSLSEVHHHTTNRDIRNHHTTTSTTSTGDRLPRDREPLDPNYPGTRKGLYPDDDGGKPPSSTNINYSVNTTNYRTDSTSGSHPPFPTDKIRRDPSLDDHRDPPGRPNDPHRNVTININKSTTHTTHTTTRDGVEYPHGDNQTPLTSTPYRGRSRSPERRYPSGPSDSLERVRRHPQPGLPFPDTSPVRPQNDSRIPRKVDDLMHEFPVKNGGPHTTGYHMHPDAEPLLADTDVRGRRTRTDISLLPPERNEINTMSPSRLREEREKTKNQAGPPVYYPPGHEAFSESMHTMTLKEGGRRGKAKWRREAASGYKESSAHSESKGGMAMVPVCLPLCCGAACTIM